MKPDRARIGRKPLEPAFGSDEAHDGQGFGLRPQLIDPPCIAVVLLRAADRINGGIPVILGRREVGDQRIDLAQDLCGIAFEQSEFRLAWRQMAPEQFSPRGRKPLDVLAHLFARPPRPEHGKRLHLHRARQTFAQAGDFERHRIWRCQQEDRCLSSRLEHVPGSAFGQDERPKAYLRGRQFRGTGQPRIEHMPFGIAKQGFDRACLKSLRRLVLQRDLHLQNLPSPDVEKSIHRRSGLGSIGSHDGLARELRISLVIGQDAICKGAVLKELVVKGLSVQVSFYSRAEPEGKAIHRSIPARRRVASSYLQVRIIWSG